jgi:hypothetical protein
VEEGWTETLHLAPAHGAGLPFTERLEGSLTSLAGMAASATTLTASSATAAGQCVIRELSCSNPAPGRERRRADLRLHAREGGHHLYINAVGGFPL